MFFSIPICFVLVWSRKYTFTLHNRFILSNLFVRILHFYSSVLYAFLPYRFYLYWSNLVFTFFSFLLSDLCVLLSDLNFCYLNMNSVQKIINGNVDGYFFSFCSVWKISLAISPYAGHNVARPLKKCAVLYRLFPLRLI